MKTGVIILLLTLPLMAEDAPALAGRMMKRLQADDRNWLRMQEALSYLGQHQVEEALAPCRRILRDASHSAFIRGQALLAIARIQTRDVADDLAVAASDPALQGALAEALESLSAAAPDGLIEPLLASEDEGVRLRALAAQAGRYGEAAWAQVSTVNEATEAHHQWLVRALAQVGHEAALERLVSLPRSGDRRSAFIRGLHGIPNPALIKPLLAVAAECNSAEFATVLSALRLHDREAVLLAMRQLLPQAEDRQVRALAKMSLRFDSNPEVALALSQTLERVTDNGTIQDILMALGQIEVAPWRFETQFRAFLDHKQDRVRLLAVRGIGHARETNLFAALRERVADDSGSVAMAALVALRRAPFRHVPRGELVQYLEKPLLGEDEDLREAAMELLSIAASPEDFEPAMALFGDRLRGSDDAAREFGAAALQRVAPLDRRPEVAKVQGFLGYFHVLGTFMNDREHKAFHEVQPPDEAIDFTQTLTAKYIWNIGEGKKSDEPIDREISWQHIGIDRTDGRLNMAVMTPPPPKHAIGYAVADFASDEEQAVTLTVDGDDAFRLILNGKQIIEEVGEVKRNNPPLTAAATVTLRKGPNRLVIKSANLEDAWWVRVRLTREGKPVMVRQAKPEAREE